MVSQSITFQSDVNLVGTLHLPDGTGAHPALVVMHLASGGDRAHTFYQHLAEHLPAAGIAVFVFDRRGSGQSQGDFETADFEMLAADGVAAANVVAARPDIAPEKIGVYGISQGSWLAPIVAARRPATACIVAVSGSGVSPARQMDYTAERALRDKGFAESSIAHMLYLRQRVNDYYRGRVERVQVQRELDIARGESWFSLAYLDEELPLEVAQDKWFHEMDYDPLPIWREVTQPTLFIYPEDDRWIPSQESLAAYQSSVSGMADVTFAPIPNSDHLMGLESGTHVSSRYLALLIEWLNEHLG